MLTTSNLQQSLPSHTVIRIESRGQIELPLNELMSDGVISVFDQVEKKGLAFVQFRKQKAVVSAGAYVGLIPLTPTLWLNIQPRLPVSNLNRVLEVAIRPLSLLPASSRNYELETDQSNIVLSLLLQSLTSAVKDIEQEGYYKAYVREQHRSSHPRGRIDLLESMRLSNVLGKPHQVVSSQFSQTPNVEVNRVLKEALRSALEWLLPLTSIEASSLRDSGISLRNFPASVAPLRARDVREAERIYDKRSLPSSRSYYYPALHSALLILRGQGLSLTDVGDDVPLDSFVVNFETMFEDYLRNALLQQLPARFTVQDGNKPDEAKKSLFDDKTDPPAQPDMLVIDKMTGAKLVVEVKYKTKIDRTDINQALTYGLSYRTERVLLLHLAKGQADRGQRLIGTVDHRELHGYRFDLSAQDLISEEALLAAAIEQLLTT